MLQRIYYQFQRGNKPLFGSRLMDWLGRTFIGTPDELGAQDMRADHEAHFYYVMTDRLAPEDRAEFDKWSAAAPQPNLMRHAYAPAVARGAFLASASLVIVLCVAAWLVGAGKSGIQSIGQRFGGSSAVTNPVDNPGAGQVDVSVEECNAYLAQIKAGVLQAEQLDQSIRDTCSRLVK